MTGGRDGNDPLVATPSQTVGPFFHFALTPDASGGRVCHVTGDPIQLTLRVTDGRGEPVTDAVVEIWQAGQPAAKPAPGADGVTGFGRLATGADGTCTFETVRPGTVPDGAGGRQAPHINVCLFARGLLRQIHTRIYFAGDPALGADAVLALVPEDRRQTLLARPEGETAGRWRFDIRLQGGEETVFFDV